MKRARFSTVDGSLLVAALGFLLAGCRSDATPPPLTCTYRSESHAFGTTFPAGDGCNSCTCVDDGVPFCTERACPDDRKDGGALVKSDAPAPPPPDSRAADTAPVLPDAPRGPDAPHACDFSTSYEYGEVGGLRVFVDRTQLEPGNRYTHQRTPLVGNQPLSSCSPPLPSCGAQDIITAYDIEVHDLGDPDVLAALAQPTPPLYGRDLRPVDGTVFEFLRKDGRGFLMGAECRGNSGPGTCRDIPRGITQLATRLRDLDRQQLGHPDCRNLRGMP